MSTPTETPTPHARLWSMLADLGLECIREEINEIVEASKRGGEHFEDWFHAEYDRTWGAMSDAQAAELFAIARECAAEEKSVQTNTPTKKMRIYLAARYSRREELCGYRDQLRALGHDVQARWLDGGHQISDAGVPIGETGEALVEAGGLEAAVLRGKFAQDDWDDVSSAELVINFTEPPRSKANRGGRHVEFGIALALRKRVIVVGHRENIFHWMPRVEFSETWEDAIKKCAAGSQQ